MVELLLFDFAARRGRNGYFRHSEHFDSI